MAISPTPPSAPAADDPRASAIRAALAGTPDPPAPLTPDERTAFRARLSALLAAEGADALLVEPGGTLEHLTGVVLGRSERLLAAAVLADGTFVWVSPAFEASRVATLCERASGSPDLGSNVLPWDEHESAIAALAADLGRRGVGRVLADPDVRTRFALPLGAALGRPVEDGAA
ncbi:MAG: aminopeptidase P family N-terminal domain-containing protein, partial [Planctomycetota bacterium]